MGSVFQIRASLAIIFLLFTFVHPTSAEIIWTEDFNDGNLENWEVIGYNYTNNPISEWGGDVSINDGMITSPSSTNQIRTYACHQSNVVFGTWSFDWHPSTNDDFVFFIADDFDWINQTQLTANAYALKLKPVFQGIFQPGIEFHQYAGSETTFRIINSYPFSSNITGSHHIEITRNQTGFFKVYFDEDIIIEISNMDVIESDQFCFALQGDTAFDNIEVDDSISIEDDNNFLLYGFIFVGVSIGLGYSFRKAQLFYSRRREFHLNKKIIDTLSEVIDYRPYLFYLFFGQSLTDNSKVETDLKYQIPHEIYNFKFLMHPVRLTMVKLLIDKIELNSIEIKGLVNISWGAYSNHVKSLKKKGYIDIREEFKDGSVRQIISLTPFGIKQYNSLSNLLDRFIKESDEDNKYMKKETDTFDWVREKSLYPEDLSK
ncbi:MAG: transcriptional regulator [Candidatus Kariarchaeaceae archaeon]